MTADVVVWLTNTLDREAAAAESAATDAGYDWDEPSSGVVQTADDLLAFGDSRVTRFIAAHDPGAVLASVEADRAILDEHSDNGGYTKEADGSLVRSGPVGDQCLTCVDTSDGAWHLSEMSDYATFPCRTVLLVASRYRHRDGWREEWKP